MIRRLVDNVDGIESPLRHYRVKALKLHVAVHAKLGPKTHLTARKQQAVANRAA